MKRMLPRTRLNETFYRLVVKLQLYRSAWQPCLQSPEGFAVGRKQLGFLGLRAALEIALTCTGLHSVTGFRAELEYLVPVWSFPSKPGAVAVCWVKAVFAPTCAAGLQPGHVTQGQFKPGFWSEVHDCT